MDSESRVTAGCSTSKSLPGAGEPASELIRAALKGNTRRVIELLEAGANPNERDVDGRTALMEAAFGGHAGPSRALLKAGANPDARDSDGCSSLMEAASKGRLEIVKLLVAAGADVNARNRDGRTALDLTARAHPGLARYIRRSGGH
jgi:ankyrin repeat protein